MSGIFLKTKEELEILKEGGHKLGRILKALTERVAVGSWIADLDQWAEEEILKVGGRPSFKGYRAGGESPFPSTVCISINEQVVHGPANVKRKVVSGDLVSFDIGMEYPAKQGLFTDTAYTVGVGRVSEQAKLLINVTNLSLIKGIEKLQVGGVLTDVSRAIEAEIAPYGFGIVRNFVGHGVGKKVHEEPRIPNYYEPGQPPIPLVEGMVLALEPMVTMGDEEVEIAADGWTVVTKDGGLAAHFEHSIALTGAGPVILTEWA